MQSESQFPAKPIETTAIGRSGGIVQGIVNAPKLFGAVSALTIVALCIQFALDPSLDNILASMMAAGTTVLTFGYLFGRNGAFARLPLSSLSLFGLNISSIGGALLYQSFTFVALAHNLESPVETFFLVSLLNITLIGSHFVYSKLSLFARAQSKMSDLLTSIWLFRMPSNLQIWSMAAIGLAATWFVASAKDVEYGDLGTKLVAGLTLFAYAPGLVLFGKFMNQERVNEKVKFTPIIIYFGLLVGLSLANNSRSTFAVPVISVALMFLIFYASDQIKLDEKLKLRLVLFVIPGFFLLSMISDLAVAMVIVREYRSELNATELVRLTWDTFWDSNALDSYRQTLKYFLAEGYNETYIANPIFARLINIKFDDNMITYASLIGPERANELIAVTIDKIWALLPTPVIDFFGINVAKGNLEFSIGDYIYYMVTDDALFLGQYKVGSIVGHGIVAAGYLFYIFAFFLAPFMFLAADALFKRKSSKLLLLSPLAIINIYPIFTAFTGDSILNVIAFLLRSMPQTIFLYVVLLFALTAIFPSGADRRRQS